MSYQFACIWYGVHNEVGRYIIVMYFRATMVNNKQHKYSGCFCYLFKRLYMKMGTRNSRLALA